LISAVLALGCAAQPPSASGPGGSTPDGAQSTPTAAASPTVASRTAAPSPAVSVSPSGSTGEITSGPLPVGRLLFDSDRSGNLDIWHLAAGSAEATQVTSDPGSDRISAWHPDGDSVIFSSDRLGGPSIPSGGALRAYGLFIASLDGSADRHLLGARTFNSGAHYSPDGSQVAFSSDARETFQVFVVPADFQPNEGIPGPLTTEDLNDAPDWSPDGLRIAFNSLRDGNREIYVMDAGGSNQLRLTDNPAADSSPAWSPDGSLIAFHSDRAGGRHIFVMNADGSDVRQLTFGEQRDGFPTWSPDGEWLAFDRMISRDDAEIVVLRLADGELINVTNDPARDAFPAWGP
jgi:TolB protein